MATETKKPDETAATPAAASTESKPATKTKAPKNEALVKTAEVAKDEHDARVKQNEEAQVAAQAASLTFGAGGADPDKDKTPEEIEKITAERSARAAKVLKSGPRSFSTDHYVAGVTEVNGQEILTLSARGWVGPAGFTTHAGNLDEVIETLQGLK